MSKPKTKWRKIKADDPTSEKIAKAMTVGWKARKK